MVVGWEYGEESGGAVAGVLWCSALFRNSIPRTSFSVLFITMLVCFWLLRGAIILS